MIGTIASQVVGFVQSYVHATVVAIVSATIQEAILTMVVKTLTFAVLAVLTGVVVQVLGKLIGAEGLTNNIAKFLYAVAIIAIAVAAIVAKSLMLALVFLGGAIIFLSLMDAVFGTEAAKTFTSAAVEIVEAVVDVTTELLAKTADLIGTGVSSIFGGLWSYLLLGVGGFVIYKVLTRESDNSEVRLDVSSQEPSRVTGSSYVA